MKSRNITSNSEIEAIIHKCEVCHMAMVDTEGMPYVLPMNFGYSEGAIYLHSGQQGKKIDILKQNNNVCVSFSTDYQLRFQNEKVACSYGWQFRSVLAYGKVEFITEFAEKEKALNIIMRNYSGREFSYNAPAVRDVNTYKVVISKMEGREKGY